MFEDDDFAMRVRDAGYRTVCAEDCFVHHWGEKSFKKLERPEYYAIFEANKAKFEEKWGEPWEPHVYRDWDAEAARPPHYERFSRDLWIWSCPLCGTAHRSMLGSDTQLDCSECGATPETRTAAIHVAMERHRRPIALGPIASPTLDAAREKLAEGIEQHASDAEPSSRRAFLRFGVPEEAVYRAASPAEALSGRLRSTM